MRKRDTYPSLSVEETAKRKEVQTATTGTYEAYHWPLDGVLLPLGDVFISVENEAVRPWCDGCLETAYESPAIGMPGEP